MENITPDPLISPSWSELEARRSVVRGVPAMLSRNARDHCTHEAGMVASGWFPVHTIAV
jgi:hypothetical protein